MTIKKTLGGDRLGSGNKMQVALKNFERSNHDVGYIWRSTLAPGTLVPYMVEVGLPGDTFDIKLNANVMTYPTVGPMFGSFKLQLDVFMCPIRLYQAQLHNNKLGIGMKMDTIKLPQLELYTKNIDKDSNVPIDIQQVNPSSLLAYLGMRGIGNSAKEGKDHTVTTKRNAVPYLAYWDIYKNYYANKQEEKAAYINHGEDTKEMISYWMIEQADGTKIYMQQGVGAKLTYGAKITLIGDWIRSENITVVDFDNVEKPFREVFHITNEVPAYDGREVVLIEGIVYNHGIDIMMQKLTVGNLIREDVQINTFPLSNIDDMREDILSKIKETSPYIIKGAAIAPYGSAIDLDADGYCKMRYVQNGLALKTYQSDVFNNWINTEWIEGDNGINALTAIDVSSGVLQVDQFYLAKKVYDMLNRIAVSGGTYYNWIESVYSEDPFKNAETPVYMGGLSKEVVFEEVVSNAETEANSGVNPLGTLAGKGGLSGKHKGGSVTVKVSEPSYIIGIVSLTPRIDYSQGNRWDTRLRTMDDFHKPSLDGIGFQDLITEQMAWWDTSQDTEGGEILKSAGKQPAWINYMTNYNRTYGNFADPDKEMFMTLNRKYEFGQDGIVDLTTYIDPTKFNYAFAQTDITAQNFWVQIGVDMEARRKISAKQIPNL